ncbi:MAG: DUF11 domain-containing protein [Actinobacteria bacterium]|nr:DUF11 domain-containing protein [Actinomycetota bacterium]
MGMRSGRTPNIIPKMPGVHPGRSRLMWLMAVVALVAGLTIPAASDSLAAGGCDPHAPLADLDLNQQATSPRDGVVSYLLTVKNLGPCNADGIALTDTLPAGVSLEAIKANPSSMQCAPLPPTSQSEIRCELTPNVGVPGNVSLELIGTAPTGAITNFARVELLGATTDPDDRNNASYGALIGTGGGSLETGALAPRDERNQVVIPPGVSGSVGLSRGHLDDPCPPGFSNCTGRPITITSPISTSAPITLVFDKDATLIDEPSRELFIIYLPDDAQQWVRVAKCKNPRTYPCLSSAKRMSDGALVTPANPKGYFYRLTVITLHTSRWR